MTDPILHQLKMQQVFLRSSTHLLQRIPAKDRNDSINNTHAELLNILKDVTLLVRRFDTEDPNEIEARDALSKRSRDLLIQLKLRGFIVDD